MFIGTLQVELLIPDSESLKGKRLVLKSLKQRLTNKFNVSVAEIDHNELWQRAAIGIAMVGNKQKFLTESMQNILNFIDDEDQTEILDHLIEIL